MDQRNYLMLLTLIFFSVGLLGCGGNLAGKYLSKYGNLLEPYYRTYDLLKNDEKIGEAVHSLAKVKLDDGKMYWVKQEKIDFEYVHNPGGYRKFQLLSRIRCDKMFNLVDFYDKKTLETNVGIKLEPDSELRGVVKKNVNNRKSYFIKYKGKPSPKVHTVLSIPPVCMLIYEYLMTSVISRNDRKIIYEYFSISALENVQEVMSWKGTNDNSSSGYSIKVLLRNNSTGMKLIHFLDKERVPVRIRDSKRDLEYKLVSNR